MLSVQKLHSTVSCMQITLRKGYAIPDLKIDLANLYRKAGLKGWLKSLYIYLYIYLLVHT